MRDSAHAPKGTTLRYSVVATLAALGLAGCQTATGEKNSSVARPATKAEIEAIAVGNTVNNAMTYNADGTYLFKGANPGRYQISSGKICVNFQSGGRRCDRIVAADDGQTFTMINRSGDRFPFG